MFVDWIQVVTGSLLWEYPNMLVNGLVVNFCVYLLAADQAVSP